MVDLPTWRAQHGYTQARLAKLLGVADRTIKRWEAGTTAQPPDLAARLLAIAALPKAPAVLTGQTHPYLYKGKVRGGFTRGPLHPAILMSAAELAPWRVTLGDDTAAIWEAVLDSPEYKTALVAAQTRAATMPQKKKISDEEFYARAAAGATINQLLTSTKGD